MMELIKKNANLNVIQIHLELDRNDILLVYISKNVNTSNNNAKYKIILRTIYFVYILYIILYSK